MFRLLRGSALGVTLLQPKLLPGSSIVCSTMGVGSSKFSRLQSFTSTTPFT
ncbi:hypothetical protein cypCar_00010061 [Cyprinus carpio]|nr:hypothetical protein cypCar_00010061 [Cyprinus carpio]